MIDNNEAVIASRAAMSNDTSSLSGGRELVWKTSDGAEKRLALPIEMIKEDVMDDPERLLKTVG